jgi:TRAP-type mannitol/chloroaromatic compound transport system substrate-binding protein
MLNNLKLAASALVLTGLLAGANAGEATADRVNWKMGSAFPSKLVQLGSGGVNLSERLEAMSGGDIRIRFYEPHALVPPLEMFDAISAGSLDAAWSTPGYWFGKEKSLALFAAVPFGPSAGEYLGWVFNGGGHALMDEIYAKHNIKALICGVIAPEASGWFRKEINSTDDLKGLKMRFFGLGAKVMEKIGVSTQLIAGGDIYPALERGSIDATEYSMPAIDLDLGFYQIAKHYYFPGWHQQSTLADRNRLPSQHRDDAGRRRGDPVQRHGRAARKGRHAAPLVAGDTDRSRERLERRRCGACRRGCHLQASLGLLHHLPGRLQGLEGAGLSELGPTA